MALRAYKFRLYPNKTQKATLAKVFGCVRFVWNKNVEVFNGKDNQELGGRMDKETLELLELGLEYLNRNIELYYLSYGRFRMGRIKQMQEEKERFENKIKEIENG